MAVTDVILRSLAVGALLAGGFSALFRKAPPDQRLVVGLASLAGAAFIVRNAPVLFTVLGPVGPLASLLSYGLPGYVWLAARVLTGSARPSILSLTPTIGLTFLGVLAFSPDNAVGWVSGHGGGLWGWLFRGASCVVCLTTAWLTARHWLRSSNRRRNRRGAFLLLATGAVALACVNIIAQAFGAPAVATGCAEAAMVAAWAVAMSAASRFVLEEGAAASRPRKPALPKDADLGRLASLMEDRQAWRREGLTVGRLAADMGLPEHRLRRLITHDLGYRNFTAFLDSHRIASVKAQLSRAGPVNVAAVAFDHGYGSLGPFYRAFRAATGMAPLEWRARITDSGKVEESPESARQLRENAWSLARTPIRDWMARLGSKTMAILKGSKIATAGAFVVLIGVGACALIARQDDAYRRPQQMVRLPDGHRLNLICMGRGTPTVILESGLGVAANNWIRTQPEIAKTTRVCAYERAGYNFSDPGPLPRTSDRVVQDLSDLLTAAKLPAPYIMVGHSLGGQYARLFTSLHRDQVAGLVLIDSGYVDVSTPDLEGAEEMAAARRCITAVAEQRLWSASDPAWKSCGPPPPPGSPLASPDWAKASLSEEENGAHVEPVSYGDMPVIILTAGRTDSPADKAMVADIIAQHRALVGRLSSRGQQRTVAGSGHVIQMFKPEAVIEAVNDVVAQARTHGSSRPPSGR